MSETNLENNGPRFIFPSFEHEEGEIERVQEYFQVKTDNFVQKFLDRARTGKLVRLSDDVWNMVENTDSHSENIMRGDWDAVAECSNANENKRDWQSLRSKMQSGTPVDAAVIARRGNILHLVSGNTRLMVARAMGIRPEVLIVDITDIQ
jgi:hypothetical protein